MVFQTKKMNQITLFFITIIITLSRCKDNVEQAFIENEVIPDVIGSAPDTLLKVEFTESGKEVTLGNELAPMNLRQHPKISYDADPDSFYTLIMTDPDAPNRKTHEIREWAHWLVVNIPGNKISEGEVIIEYVGSAPPKDSGLHRYVFLLFKQPGKLSFDEPHHSNTDAHRGHFSSEELSKKYNLGKPIAGNFYQAQYDDSVPALHRQLGI